MQKKKLSIKRTFRVLWKHTHQHTGFISLLMLLSILGDVMIVVIPLYFRDFFDLLGSGSKTPESIDGLMFILWMIFLLSGVKWVFDRGAVFLTNIIQPKIKAELEAVAFKDLLDRSYKFFSNAFVGSLVRKIHRFADGFDKFFDEFQWHILPLIVLVIGELIVLFQRSVLLGYVLLGSAFIIGGCNILFASWKIKFDLEKAELDTKTSAIMSDVMTNSLTIKLFASKNRELKNFLEAIGNWRRAQTRVWHIESIAEGAQAALMIVAEFAMLIVAVKLWRSGEITLGDFTLIQSYLIVLFNQVWNLGKSVRYIYASLADVEEMIDILETPYGVSDVPHAKELVVTSPSLQFQSVDFRFHDKREVLKDFSLDVIPKEKIALVGSSGAGKSTITKLLLRLYDVSAGSILIDGQPVAEVTQDSLRKNIALVPQDPILFHRTLRENIRYGKPEATDEEVEEVARKARCHEFIAELPQGYDTLVGERGVKLSGGERQRIAIARALLKNAPILILDEATSSLDSESESLIQEALDVLMKDKTTIVIAHRLSTIMRMDRIAVIDQGKVADSGTHAELLAKEGIYKKLWDIQVGGFIE